MKFTPNKYLILIFFLAGSMSFSAPGNPPPPPPAGAPPPGFSIDSGILVAIFFGIIFSFLFLKNYSKSNSKT
jgi:drug/metabolite transporter (DMT)-like permease